jgi:hypothetical protein
MVPAVINTAEYTNANCFMRVIVASCGGPRLEDSASEDNEEQIADLTKMSQPLLSQFLRFTAVLVLTKT